MEKGIIDSVKDTINNWWISLLLGALFVIMGIVLMVYPFDTYVALAVMFSVLWFVSGIMEIAFAVSNRETMKGWGWTLTAGIIDLLLGFVLITLPQVSMAIMPFLVAFWFMYKGISSIGFAIDLQHLGVKGWGWLLALGILVVILAFMLLFTPTAAALILVYITAFAFLMIGIFRIMLSFELKNLKNKFKDAGDKFEQFAERIEHRIEDLSKSINRQ